MTCPRCAADAEPGDRFCAECGARLAAPEPPPAQGRAEAAGPRLAGRTDPGRTHAVNQDAFALAGPEGDGAILVVCDGVSNSQTPEQASAAAARTALARLTAARDAGEARAEAMEDAIRQAHAAVCALPFDRQSDVDPPATTIVAAWVHAAGATLGWLGDSRAYVLPPDGPARLLTRDHSWMDAMLDGGGMTEAEARRDPRAHALLHCLGTTDFARATPCPAPGAAEAEGCGWLILCSDGLWNYAERPDALAAAAGEGVRGDAADLCARLVSFALSAGGRDNITALAAALRPRRAG